MPIKGDAKTANGVVFTYDPEYRPTAYFTPGTSRAQPSWVPEDKALASRVLLNDQAWKYRVKAGIRVGRSLEDALGGSVYQRRVEYEDAKKIVEAYEAALATASAKRLTSA